MIGVASTLSYFARGLDWFDGSVRSRFMKPKAGPRISSGRILARRVLSYLYLRGEGIEVGALHEPLPVRSGIKVRYVDRMSVKDLREHYPELNGLDLVEPDILDDGETLSKVQNLSQDFIIANHFIEHTEDPIGTIERHLSKLRVGGVLYLTVPNKLVTFDQERPITSIEHVLLDYKHGPGRERREHYAEWVHFVGGIRDEKEAQPHIDGQMQRGYSIHFHVWDFNAFLALLDYMRIEMKFPFKLERKVLWAYNPLDMIFILRKTAA